MNKQARGMVPMQLFPSLSKMMKDGPCFQLWGITCLKTVNASSGNTFPRFTVSHLQPCISDRANLGPCPEHYCENPRAHVYWKEMVQSPIVSSRWRISLRRSFYEIHPTSARRRPSPSGTFGLPTKSMGMLASSSLDVTDGIKEKMWGTCLPGRPRKRGQTSQDM